MEKPGQSIVIDCSIIAAGLLTDEDSKKADQILRALCNSMVKGVVPALFYLEIHNTLLMARKRQRLNDESLAVYQHTIQSLPLDIDYYCINPHHQLDIAKVAQNYQLTTYDACYLEMANRLNIKLATLDKALLKAAKTAKLDD